MVDIENTEHEGKRSEAKKKAAPGEKNKILMLPPSQSHTQRGRKH